MHFLHCTSLYSWLSNSIEGFVGYLWSLHGAQTSTRFALNTFSKSWPTKGEAPSGYQEFASFFLINCSLSGRLCFALSQANGKSFRRPVAHKVRKLMNTAPWTSWK